MNKLAFEQSISELQAAMDRGELTSESLTKYFLERIEAYDKHGPRLNAIISINPNALELARRLDQERKMSGKRGPLHGIPVVIKDNIDTFDMATTAGSQILANHHPTRDAEIVHRLRDAGALILAKTNLSEFACHGWTDGTLIGQTLNPYDLTRTPGGSSGGTAVAVAANLAVAGLGTDTANSVRSPASATSLVGFRPTTGLFSTEGIIPVSSTQDSPGTLARSVTDTALLFDVLAPKATLASYTNSLKGDGLSNKRIGILVGNIGDQSDVLRVFEESKTILRQNGVELIEIDIPELASDRISRECDVQLYEFNDQVNEYLKEHPEAPVKSFKEIVDTGLLYPHIVKLMVGSAQLKYPQEHPDYRNKLANIKRNRQLVLAVMDENKLDALTYPHQKVLVEEVDSFSQAGRNGIVASILGFPSISVPAGYSLPSETAPDGVPIGVEFVARPYQEDLVFEIAYAFEQKNPQRKPPKATP